MTLLELYFILVSLEKHRKFGISIHDVQKTTGLSKRQCYNKLTKLIDINLVHRIGMGTYSVDYQSFFALEVHDFVETKSKREIPF